MSDPNNEGEHALLFRLLKEMGIREVVFNIEGGGDSGYAYLESIWVEDDGPLSGETMENLQKIIEGIQIPSKDNSIGLDVYMQDIVLELVEDELGGGWENGEGYTDGTYIFDVRQGIIQGGVARRSPEEMEDEDPLIDDDDFEELDGKGMIP